MLDPLLFLPFIMPILAWYFDISIDIFYFLKSSLVFHIILFSSVALFCSFKKALSLLSILLYLHSSGYIFPFLPCHLLLFFPQLFVKHSMAWLTEFCKPLHQDKTVIHEGTSDNYHISISTRKHTYFPSISCSYFCVDFFPIFTPIRLYPLISNWPIIGVTWELTILK